MTKHILYLASGSSRRFGENKLLYPRQGEPLFRHGLDLLREVAESREDCTLTVVSRYPEIREAAQTLGVRAVDSPQSDLGVSYTIRAGLEALGAVPEADFLLFVVADQPNLTRRSVERLLDQARPGTEGACLCWEGQPGNPTLFSAKRIPELLALEGDMGGRKVLRRHACIQVSAGSPEELWDIDTKEDLT